MRCFFIILVPIFLFATCKKRVFDYRNKYLGEYSFSGYDFIKGVSGGDVDTSFFNDIDGELSYSRSDERDEIRLFIEGILSLYCTINKAGDLTICNGKGNINGDKKISVSFDKFICDYGKALLGGKHIYAISGEKK